MVTSQLPPDLIQRAKLAKNILVLSGAGMSAESGVPTFRDEEAGLWHQYSPEDLATEDGWRADPQLVWGWYLWRIGVINTTTPNAGHLALAQWAQLNSSIKFNIVTQNVDDLHERAGSKVLAHLHGRIDEFRCIDCAKPAQADLTNIPTTPQLRIPTQKCACGGDLRPNIVFFGENLDPIGLEASFQAAQHADLTIVVGTSSVVYPAAALPNIAYDSGSYVVELNPNPTNLGCQLHWATTAAIGLPELVSAIKAE
ncbi:MAG: NAD-dependent deacylase [Propionibacterium sp.]|nr:MAG: NAD-dependent deacylase [Propionibacterium sp.]